MEDKLQVWVYEYDFLGLCVLYLSILEPQKQHLLHQGQPRLLRVSPLLFFVLLAALVVLLAARGLLSVGRGVTRGLGPPLHQARVVPLR